MSPRKLPLATVFFEGDLRLTTLQAISIDRLYDLDSLSTYFLVLKGQDNSALRRKIERNLRHTSRELRDKIVILDREEVVGDTPVVNYYDQQAVKLGLSRLVEDDYYIMLDGKNHFVAPASADTFFVGDKPIGPLSPIADYWRGYVDRSVAAVDGDTSVEWGQMMPSVTPFVFITEQVRALTDHLETKYEGLIPQAMTRARGTEFIMYYAFITTQGLLGEYEHREMPNRTLYTQWPQDPEIVKRYINDVGDTRAMFGLHRNRLPQLDDEQKSLITDLWRKNLLDEWEDPDWFFHFDN